MFVAKLRIIAAGDLKIKHKYRLYSIYAFSTHLVDIRNTHTLADMHLTMYAITHVKLL